MSWMLLQARAWMGWEMGIGFGLSTTLQRWNGQAWDKAGAQPAAPPSPGPSANVGAASAAAAASSPSAGASSPSTGNGAAKFSSSSSSSPPPPPGSISGSVAQAMLECHYSFNNAFLEDTPLLEVRAKALAPSERRICLTQNDWCCDRLPDMWKMQHVLCASVTLSPAYQPKLRSLMSFTTLSAHLYIIRAMKPITEPVEKTKTWLS